MALEQLRILFISGYFPPKAPMGAVRPAKLAEYWRESRHDVRVVAIALPPQEWPHVPASGVRTHYVGYKEPGQTVTRLTSAIRQSQIARILSPVDLAEIPEKSGIATRRRPGLRELYRQAVQLPDRYRFWIGAAVETVKTWRTSWQPDLIYSSGPPNSGHIAARRLSKCLGAPWIAEIRDAWIDNPNRDTHWLVKPAFNRQARHTLNQAAGLVTVTERDREQMTAAFRAPVVLSYNGFDPKDFGEPVPPQPVDRERLTILHAGEIYCGRRDPTPLFRAISALGAQAGKVRCLFRGDESGSVASLAESCGVSPYVETGGVLRRSEILSLERAVDVLLECHWQDSAGDGVIPGKLFEYIGARRPILSLGSTTAEAAVIVRDNKLGLASNDPNQICKKLLEWVKIKQQTGRLPDLANAVDVRFERQYQFQAIDGLIENVIGRARAGENRRQ